MRPYQNENMTGETMMLRGEVVRGLRAASGLRSNEKTDLPGTITLQRPFFTSAGVKRAEDWYTGTINITIFPNEFEITKPDYAVTAEWTLGVIETFWLVDITIEHNGKTYPAYVYYPYPSEVKAHPDTLIEILAQKIPDLHYGDVAAIRFQTGRMSIKGS